MSDGRILYALQDDACFIRIEGDIRYTESVSFDNFIDRLFDRERPSRVLIDLTAAELIDSTNLGLLAKIAKRLMSLRNDTATIFSTSEDINMLLESIGFDDVFNMVEDEKAPPTDMRELPGAPANRRAQGITMVEAHKELMELNEKNRDVFRNVVHMLEKDLDENVP